MLTSEELARYDRQLGMADWGTEGQERLKRSHVFVAGAGGLGSPVIYYLAAAGVGGLTVCDPDTIDLTNLNRQILHAVDRLGTGKALSAVRSIRKLNPNVNIRAIQAGVTRRNAAKLAGDADLIIDCLDNFQARHHLNLVSVAQQIPMIHAGVAGFGGQVTFIDTPDTPCLACLFPKKREKTGLPVVGATAGVIGSIQALEAIQFLVGIGPALKNRLLFWDGLSMKFETITVKPDPFCGVCARVHSK